MILLLLLLGIRALDASATLPYPVILNAVKDPAPARCFTGPVESLRTERSAVRQSPPCTGNPEPLANGVIAKERSDCGNPDRLQATQSASSRNYPTTFGIATRHWLPAALASGVIAKPREGSTRTAGPAVAIPNDSRQPERFDAELLRLSRDRPETTDCRLNAQR